MTGRDKSETRISKSETIFEPGNGKFATGPGKRMSIFGIRISRSFRVPGVVLVSSVFQISDFRFRISRASALVFLTLVLSPSRAAAHLVTTGMGPVYDGIGHLLLTPEDLVPVLALALYAGLRGATAGRRAMFLLPVAWFVGGLAGSFVSDFEFRVSNFGPAMSTATSLLIPALSFLILGGLVAADLWMPPAAVTGLAVSLGLVHGSLNGAALRDGAGILGLIGIMTMLFVLVTLTSAFVVTLGKPWARVAMRVAGSWIAAVGLLMLGWAVRGGHA